MNEIITEKNYPIKKLWALKSILVVLPLLIIVPFSFSLDEFREVYEIKFYVIMIIVAVISYLIFFILKISNFHYSVEEKFLTLKQGILSKQQRHIPYGVIQNIFVKQDLFDRVFGIASLTIENASQGMGYTVASQRKRRSEIIGFSGNMVVIPGLTKQSVKILKEIILQKMKENPIEDSQSGL